MVSGVPCGCSCGKVGAAARRTMMRSPAGPIGIALASTGRVAMKRLSIVGSALVAIVAVSIAMLGPWGSTTAQEDRSLYVSVTELRYGWNENLPDGGTCSFTGQQFGYLSTVPMQIVVEDETHRTVAARDVGGTIRHNEGEDWYRCDATFNLPLPDAAVLHGADQRRLLLDLRCRAGTVRIGDHRAGVGGELAPGGVTGDVAHWASPTATRSTPHAPAANRSIRSPGRRCGA